MFFYIKHISIVTVAITEHDSTSQDIIWDSENAVAANIFLNIYKNFVSMSCNL